MPKEVFSKPGALTVYTTAPRYGLPQPSDVPARVSPASYNNNQNGIQRLEETIPPFDCTAIRGFMKDDGMPGPGRYSPWKRPRVEIGSPLINGRNLRCPDTTYDTAGPGPAYKLPDPWIQTLVEIYNACYTMAPRVQFEKFVSNNAPTICHPHDVRCFVRGGDGRMYPWRRPKRVEKIPGPKYNVYGIYTSNSPGPFVIDFRTVANRPNIFPPVKGFGAADFDTSGKLRQNGGIFLSQTDSFRRSIPRYFESIIRNVSRKPAPGPLEYWLPSDFDKLSPKAVSAPFKSEVPMLGFPKESIGAGPAGYFSSLMTEDDLEIPLSPRKNSCPPLKAPFDTTAQRFKNAKEREERMRPSPDTYNIRGLADSLACDLCHSVPAIDNPKLGFLTSADARPLTLFQGQLRMDRIQLETPATVPGKWRNLTPKGIRTYPYHGAPPKGPASPGPIYDSNPGTKACKAQRSWFNPRDYTGTGFDNSGCGRKIEFSGGKDIPGPIYFVPSYIPGPGGRVNMTEPRFVPKKPFGPGPSHKPHEKTGSTWRATQLGTYNTYLKGIGELRPSAGGYHPRGPIDDLADKQQGYARPDDYVDRVNPLTSLDGPYPTPAASAKKTRATCK